MKSYQSASCCRLAVLLLWLGSSQGMAAEPTLARLTFWLPAEQMAAFETVYREQALPVLKRHGLVESPAARRATPDSVFSRLFAVSNPGEVLRKQEVLRADSAWKAVLQTLGATIGPVGHTAPLRYSFELYAAPAGPGRTVPAGRGQGHWRTYDVRDGLAGGNTWSILQDRDGYLWFGSWGSGVTRYDGQVFKVFTTEDGLPSANVLAIFQDREGYLWFGTRDAGVSRYDGKTFTTFNTKNSGLVDDNVKMILQDRQGNLWFAGRYGGVSRYDGEKWTTFTTDNSGLAGNQVVWMLQDRDGNLWFATFGGGVSRYDGERWTTFTTDNSGLAENQVYSITDDREGNLWFGTYRNGISRYDGETWTTFTTKDGVMATDVIWTACQDHAGRPWFGTTGGVSVYDGKEWIVYTPEGGLGSESVYSIFQDREGYYWLGTDSGVSRYDGQTFTTFTAEHGLAGTGATSILQDQEGNLWFANNEGVPHGVRRYDGRAVTIFTTDDGLVSNRVGPIVQDLRGDLWFGTANGVSRYDGRTFATYTAADGLAKNAIQCMIQDREGNLWFGTGDGGAGVSRYDGHTFTTFTTADGLAHNEVWAMCQDREGNLWFGTNSGASRYDGRTFTTFTTQDGLSDAWVLSILQDRDGYLWFGNLTGINRYDPSVRSGNSGSRFTTFSVQDGLVGNWVWSIYQDRRGHLWFGTQKGVSRYDGQVFQTVNAWDGLADRNIFAFLEDREGNLWIGANEVTRYRQPPPSPPPVSIHTVVADRHYKDVSELGLSSIVGLVAFEYGARSFKTRPEAMVYRYRLKGYEDQWHNTHSRRVEYQDLPRGDYTFEVQAVDRDLVYSEQPATVRLNVHWPYGQVALVTALCLALGLAAWQTRRVVRRDRALRQTNDALSGANKELFSVNRDLEQKSEDLEKARVSAEAANHAKSLFLANMSHEIRTPMNAILGYAQILRRGGGLASAQQRAVETIQNSGDHLLKLINNVLDISKIEAGRMELKPEDFDLQSLVKTLGMMFELQCKEKGLGWRLEGLEGKSLLVHGDEGKLRQILINLLGNAVKFTQSGVVGLRVSKEGEQSYRFAVSDTGPGISVQEQETIFQAFQQGTAGLRQGGTGLGLAISQRQLKLMDSQLQVESEVGKGSRFYFAVVLPPASSQVGVGMEGDWSRVKSLADGRTVKALVADDVVENREILASMLGGIGVRVEVVENGQQALERLGESSPDIVFLDIRMPVLDGLAAVRLIQENAVWAKVKVVAISASVLEHERQEYLQAGFDDFIDKPFSFERICQCLAQHLGVGFEYGEEEGEEGEEGAAVDWSGVTLPEELHVRLREAAELYSVTELEGCFGELERLGEERLAGHLRSLRRRHDIEAILAVLQEVKHG